MILKQDQYLQAIKNTNDYISNINLVTSETMHTHGRYNKLTDFYTRKNYIRFITGSLFQLFKAGQSRIVIRTNQKGMVE